MSQKLQLILASESPRRKDLLAKAGFSFHVFSVKVSENLEKNLTVDAQILNIARQKAVASLKAYKPLKNEDFLILAADTMVILDGEPLGKPSNPDQAVEFLSRLSGNTHEVKTAVVLIQGPVANPHLIDHLNLKQFPLRFVEGLETTKIVFRHLSDKEIREYVETGDPLDKAGAYGIQGQAQNFVEKISGSYDNVVGLPVELVEKLIRQAAWRV